jgi:hypothetical protein
MTWKPSDDVDQSVREWMKTRRWEVTRTNYDSDRKVYACVTMFEEDHHPPSGFPERFSRTTCFRSALPLRPAQVAQAMRAKPEVRLVVVQNGTRVTLEEAL